MWFEKVAKFGLDPLLAQGVDSASVGGEGGWFAAILNSWLARGKWPLERLCARSSQIYDALLATGRIMLLT